MPKILGQGVIYCAALFLRRFDPATVMSLPAGLIDSLPVGFDSRRTPKDFRRTKPLGGIFHAYRVPHMWEG